VRPKVSFGDAERKGQYFSKSVALLEGVVFFQERILQKKEKRATSTQRSSRVKVPFLSLCFLVVYFPLLRAVLLERLLDRGDRSSLLQREDVFFGRFPVVILLRHCVSLFFKPPLLYSSKAQQKQNEKKKDRRRQNFSCLVRVALGKARLCFCVCAFARVIPGERDDE
jgi:hypothetical protein